MRIGIMGGSFNPIHIGHLELAEEIVREQKLDKLLLIPVFIPPHKSSDKLVSAEHRLNMCRLAVEGMERIEVSDLEIRRGQTSYTIDTLRELKSEENSLYLIMGSDMLLTLHQWKDWEEIIRLASIYCKLRKEDDRHKITEYAGFIESKGGECIISDSRPIELSSTYIRANIADFDKVGYLIPQRVMEYIAENGLYKDLKESV